MDTTVSGPSIHDHHEKRKRPAAAAGVLPKKPRFAKHSKKKAAKAAADCGAESVLETDVANLLASAAAATVGTELPELFTTIELEVCELSAVGDGLALHGGRVYVVPFSLPGDRVAAKVVRHTPTHSAADFVAVVRPSADRDDGLVGCRYFARCSGCQLQMLAYPKQLAHKKRVIELAYAHFSALPPGVLPPVGDTVPSPLQYGYRTKLTPHFDGPRKKGVFKAAAIEPPPPSPSQSSQPAPPQAPPPPPPPPQPLPDIGFNLKGQRRVLDIEDCPIGVASVRAGITAQRRFVHDNLASFKRGATLLLRESTARIPADDGDATTQFREEKTCITDSNAPSTEYVGDFKFTSPAGAFFQNNNAILPVFTAYIRDNLSLPVVGSCSGSGSGSGGGGGGSNDCTTVTTATTTSSTATEPPKYLVDAYCGSGLFTVTCGSAVERAVGVDISQDSITYASRNAAANGIANATFIAGKAERIFADIDFAGHQTSCIVDPPRKGCDRPFLDQLLEFRPRRIVYVSCVCVSCVCVCVC